MYVTQFYISSRFFKNISFDILSVNFIYLPAYYEIIKFKFERFYRLQPLLKDYF